MDLILEASLGIDGVISAYLKWAKEVQSSRRSQSRRGREHFPKIIEPTTTTAVSSESRFTGIDVDGIFVLWGFCCGGKDQNTKANHQPSKMISDGSQGAVVEYDSAKL